jgi:hypothetical protein
MAIILTKKLTSTFAAPRPMPGDPDSPYDIVTPYIAEQVTREKTDGLIDVVDNHTSVRLWADQRSAQDYADFLTATMDSLGRSDLTNTITDL